MSNVTEQNPGTTIAGFFQGDGSGLTGLSVGSLAPLAASNALQTNGAGVITAVPQLPLARGGTGQDFSVMPQYRVVASNSAANALDSTLVYGVFPAVGALVQRDLVSAQIHIGHMYNMQPAGTADGDTTKDSAAVSTTDATPTAMFNYAGNIATTSQVTWIEAKLACDDGLGNGAAFSFLVKAANNAGTVTVTAPMNVVSAIDVALAGVTFDVIINVNLVVFRVIGLAATNLKWIGTFDALWRGS